MENAITPKEKKAAAYRAWYLANKERRSAYNCRWDKAHRGQVNTRRRAWRAKNPDKTRAHTLAWNSKNPERVAKAIRDYRATSPRYKEYQRAYSKRPKMRMIRSLRKRLHEFIHQKLGGSKNIFGISPQGLREHIQSRFADGMTWENYGHWHVDHIRPLSSFDLSTKETVREASHWTNLQPLWARDNLSKHKKWQPF